jgi:hypothetical protein
MASFLQGAGRNGACYIRSAIQPEDTMVRLAAPLSLLALVTLSSCTTPPPQTGAPQAAPNIVTHVHPYQAGSGVVQAVMAAPLMAGAGSSAEPMQRLEIKMDDGKIQYVDTASREFGKGTRVQLTEDKLIKKM